MEVYVLDDLLRRVKVYDRFTSLIWTERDATWGDFQLSLHSDQDSRATFTTGTRLAMNESMYMMIVETVESDVDSDGNYILKVSGRTTESLLDSRVAKDALADLTTDPKWTITAPPADIMRTIFHDICVVGTLDAGDIIPFIVEGSILPASTIEEPVDPITVQLDPTTVYQALADIAAAWSLGFRILRNFDNSELYFDVYAGNDRTTQQSELPAVVFSPDLDNLQNTSELTSMANYKNVAYVFSPAGYEVVYAQTTPESIAGFDRRVMVVNATDVVVTDPPTDPAIISETLIQRGNEALAKQQNFYAFDGEIDQTNQYKYGVDYFLGDLVEQRNVDGVTNYMRVTEQIFASDSEGERSYPTLTLNITIETGSWLSWDGGEHWDEVDEVIHWDDLP